MVRDASISVCPLPLVILIPLSFLTLAEIVLIIFVKVSFIKVIPAIELIVIGVRRFGTRHIFPPPHRTRPAVGNTSRRTNGSEDLTTLLQNVLMVIPSHAGNF